MSSFEVKIDGLALYGSLTATVSIVLSIYTLLRDRAKIKIKYETDQYLVGSGAKVLYKQKDDYQKYVIITAINKGRRPVKIEQAGLKIFGEKIIIFADSFSQHRPQIINEEQPKTQFCAEQQLINLKKVLYVVVRDGTGRVYKKYIKKLTFFYLIIEWLTSKFIKRKK